ncbi:hypothetical protein BS47DRAFT_194989 [Hydnum rufescens UP504]|uniref:Plastocyanin-like domain-containing protein n=1 Tax=Hydnum rufescens UP504 TaxID=1448309 RepID=A0A9P6E1M1_9AGAM|nr:hypothetical protein BS47DRAFT_194989 [Hydnum rufescens UP504]
MIQNGSNWADGRTGITQCPVPPGHSFRYKFNIEKRFGSYWWQSHFGKYSARRYPWGFRRP